MDMWKVNQALTSSHFYGSRPEAWPFLPRGLGFWNGIQGQQRNYTVLEGYPADIASMGGDGAQALAAAQQQVNQARYAQSVKIQQGQVLADEEKQPIPGPEHQMVRQTMWKGGFVDAPHLKNRFKTQQIYLIGNPITWWASTLAVILYLSFILFKIIWVHRGRPDISPSNEPMHICISASFLLLFLFRFNLSYYSRRRFFVDRLGITLFPLLPYGKAAFLASLSTRLFLCHYAHWPSY